MSAHNSINFYFEADFEGSTQVIDFTNYIFSESSMNSVYGNVISTDERSGINIL